MFGYPDGSFAKGDDMRRTTILALAITTSQLGACNRGATDEAANAGSGNEAAATTNEAGDAAKPETAAPAANETAASGGGAPDNAYMIGRWTDDGDCSAVTEFRADGTFLFPWGDTGQWSLAGDQLTLTGNTSPFTIRVIDANTLERTAAGGSPRRVTRCT
jgi:hypothetical protein